MTSPMRRTGGVSALTAMLVIAGLALAGAFAMPASARVSHSAATRAGSSVNAKKKSKKKKKSKSKFGPNVIVVPFNGDPCQSLSSTDQQQLNFDPSLPAEPRLDKLANQTLSPKTAKYTTCGWESGEVRVTYVSKGEFQTALHSKSEKPPPGLPSDSFMVYGGGLEVHKGVYYLNIDAGSRDGAVAKAVLAKL